MTAIMDRNGKAGRIGFPSKPSDDIILQGPRHCKKMITANLTGLNFTLLVFHLPYLNRPKQEWGIIPSLSQLNFRGFIPAIS